MATFGRNRQSVADIEHQLHDIFNQHPNVRLNDAGEPVVPADNLVDVFRSLTDLYGGVPLLNDDETAQLNMLIKSHPGMEVTPQILLDFIAIKTRKSPPITRIPLTGEGSDNDLDRGRSSDRDEFGNHQHRESSNDSNGGPSMYHSSGSRRSSIGPPQTPSSAKSPFDTERRQRSQPLGGTGPPPSSWTKRPAPAHTRRKSDAGSRSDSESSTSPRTYLNRHPGRHRAPSNPVSPSSSSLDLLTSPFSPTFTSPSIRPSSRPHSRAQSQPQSSFVGSGFHHDTPSRDRNDDIDHTIDANPLYDYRGHRTDGASFLTSSMSSLVMPRSPGSDSDSEDEDSYLGLVLDHSVNASTASLEPLERLDALQRANTELGKKLMEAERTLQSKLFEHEAELEDMQGRLEEVKSELSATKREEKELRSKERQNMTQIAALEAEIAKVTKNLEQARVTYTSLQKQYQEQCSLSEKYRDDLRNRDELIRSLRDSASLHDMESLKWSKEHEAYESRILSLEQELEVAQAAHVQLDEQKQENLLLKETIDRMRWDMDEMRSGLAGGATAAVGGGLGSNMGSVSKSLGAELLGKMSPWGAEGDRDAEEAEVEEELGNVSVESVGSMGMLEDGEEDDGEFIQTIITRKKRKVGSRAKGVESSMTNAFEETKEYSDSSTQYEPSYFYATHSAQTMPEPIRTSFSTQTDPEPTPPPHSAFGIQTDPEPEPEPEPVFEVPRVMLDMEIQTEDVEEELSSPPAEQVESLASSSSTILPPTPKASSSQLLVEHLQLHGDSPPAYNQISPAGQGQSQQQQQRLLAAALRKWHPGSLSSATEPSAFGAFHHEPGADEDDGVSFEPVQGGISQETVDEWKALQEELGVGCAVIDKIIENSVRVPPRLRAKEKGRSASGRFYNIYNKFYIGDKAATTNGTGGGGLNRQNLPMWVGASALVLLAMSPYMLVLFSPAAHYSVPGGPTYYDRTAWASFNGMQAAGEGFGYGVGGAYGGGYAAGGADGTAAVWDFLGRVGGGAARIARGWPT